MYAGGSHKKATFRDISVEDPLFDRFRKALKKVRNETNLPDEQILQLLRKEETVPLSIFRNKLGVLEATVKYLREEKDYSLSKIANLLNRDSRTIWSSYEKSKQKVDRLEISDSKYIPLKIFFERKLGVLEALVTHLRHQGLKYSQIATLIGRDQRTVWTVYQRGLKK